MPGSSLAQSLSGGSAPTLAALGADLLHHWEVPASSSPLITLNGSNVSQLNDRVGSAHMTQGTAANQPAFNSTGGPNNLPYINLQGITRRITGTINVAAGNRTGLYVVARHVTTGALRNMVDISAAGVAILRIRHEATDAFGFYADFTGGAQVVSAATPAYNTNWNLFAIRPLAAGAVSQVNGSTTSPDLTGTDTVKALTAASIGNVSGAASSGDIWAVFLVADPTDAKDLILRTYIAYYTGLAVV